MAMVDLVGERLLLGVLGHLHGHVVRLLGHLRVVHGLRVGGARVAHLRRHRRRVSRGVHGGGWRLELGRVDVSGRGVVVADGEAGLRAALCRFRGLIGRDSLHSFPFPGTQCRFAVSRPSPWIGNVVSPWRTRRNLPGPTGRFGRVPFSCRGARRGDES